MKRSLQQNHSDSSDVDLSSLDMNDVSPKKKPLFNTNHNGHDGRSQINGGHGSANVMEHWNTEDVCKWLVDKDLSELQPLFREEQITGRSLSMLTEPLLQKMGVRSMGKRLDVLHFRDSLTSSDNSPVNCSQSSQAAQEQCKVFNDPIHGHIELPPLCIKVMDTPQFQRLRSIKQLGGCYFVFPGASHNRFEHCIGVSHLAGKLARALKHRQPELHITEADILCLQIAGLCHDLGHGPFSHMYDGKFLPQARPDVKWRHEDVSVKMFDYLVKENELEADFEDYGLDEQDRMFIKEQIAGPLERTAENDWPYKGRDEEKSFLYEIVANKRNGIDVDKWDYFARDCHQLGINNNFDHERFTQFARVLRVEGQMQICSRDKEVGNLYDMFHTRNVLHRRAYQHKTNAIVEFMITESLLLANDYIQIPGKDGKTYSIAGCVDDMAAFTRLTDNIIDQILNSVCDELAPARKVLQDIYHRRLYKCIGQTKPKAGVVVSKADIPTFQQEIVDAVEEQDLIDPLVPDDFLIQVVNLDYGMKEKNPIDHVRFYMKGHSDKAIRVRKDQVSQMLPELFSEQHIRVFCKRRETDCIQQAGLAFFHWCKMKDFAQPKGGDIMSVELTPLKYSPVKDTPEKPALSAVSKKIMQ